MAAIITSKTRLNNTKQFLQSFKPEYIEVKSGGSGVYQNIRRNEYYLTIGKSTAWATEPNPIAPEASDMYAFNSNEDFIYSKKITYSETSSSFDTNVMHVLPRYNWTTGIVYREYNTTTDMFANDVSSNWQSGGATKPFYVVTSDDYAYRVYVCVFNNYGASSTQSPQEAEDTGNSEGQNASGFNGLIKTTDGYLWKLMFEVTSPSVLDFVTEDWIPVRTLKYDDGSRQWDIQTAAENRNNGILFFKVTEQGSGYSEESLAGSITLTINPPAHGGTTATQGTAHLTLNGNGVKGYITTSNLGTNYLYNAIVTHDKTTGNSFVLTPYISPINGLGSDPVTQLGAFNLMVLAKVKGTDAQLISNNDYRKIYLLKNPGRKGSIQTFASVPLSSTSGLSLLNITVDNNVVLNGTLPTGISTIADLIGKKIMFLTGKSKGEVKVIIDAAVVNSSANVAVLDSPFTNADHKVSASDKYMILVDADSEREMLKVTLTTDTAVSNDIQVQGGTSSAKGYVTFSDTESIGGSPRRHLYLTETFKEFQANETLTNVATSTSVGTVYSTTPQKLGFEYYYNELLYAEARQPITRAADQTENIRIVLQF